MDSERSSPSRSIRVAEVLIELATMRRVCRWAVQDSTRQLGVTRAELHLLLDDDDLLRVRRAMQDLPTGETENSGHEE